MSSVCGKAKLRVVETTRSRNTTDDGEKQAEIENGRERNRREGTRCVTAVRQPAAAVSWDGGSAEGKRGAAHAHRACP